MSISSVLIIWTLELVLNSNSNPKLEIFPEKFPIRGLSHGKFLLKYFLPGQFFIGEISNSGNISHVRAPKAGNISNSGTIS